MEYSRALRSSVVPLPRDWNRRSDRRIKLGYLLSVESDVAALNIGLATAYHRAQNRQAWMALVGMATSVSNHVMMMLVHRSHRTYRLSGPTEFRVCSVVQSVCPCAWLSVGNDRKFRKNG